MLVIDVYHTKYMRHAYGYEKHTYNTARPHGKITEVNTLPSLGDGFLCGY
jgi:hypothetical protein